MMEVVMFCLFSEPPLTEPPNSGTHCPGSCCSPRVLGWHHFLTEGLKSVSRAFLQLLLLCHCRLNSIDVKYQMWKLGVVFTDNVSPSLPPGAEAAVPADGGTLLSHVIQNRSMQWGA